MTVDRYLLDARPLMGRSGVRGIGTYARGLLDGFAEIGELDRIAVVLGRGAATPEAIAKLGIPIEARLPVVKRRAQPIVDSLAVGPVLWRLRPRIYHALEWAQPLLPGRTPVVVTVHDLIPFVIRHRDYTWMRRERLLALRQLRRADAVIAVSAATAADVMRLARVDSRRVHVVPHGVAPGLFTAPGAGDVAAVRTKLGVAGEYLLTVGVFDGRKRVPLLMDVLRRIAKTRDVALLVCGDQGVYEQSVRACAVEAGVDDRVVWAGYVDDTELRALYSDAACFVFTSAYEGFGLPMLEAMAAGAPVVAFRNTAMPEVAGTAGVLVADGDADAMARAVLEMLDDTDDRRRRVADGRAWAATFTWRRAAEETLAVYRAVEA